MTLEENMQQMREWLEVDAATISRHETRLKEHQQWMENMELAFARMAAMDEIHAAKMIEFDEKMVQVAAVHLENQEGLKELKAAMKSFLESLQRGGNGHN